MKKYITLSIIAFVSTFFLFSCKKDRVCECTSGSQTSKITFNDVSKRNAKDACVSRSFDVGNGQSIKFDCKLK